MVGVAPVKPPNIIYVQTPFLVDVQGIYVNKINPNFHVKKYPEVPRCGRQRQNSGILLVTGLVTHI